MANRKEIFSFTADTTLIDTAKAVATAIDKNFSQFVSEALEEKIKRTIGDKPIETSKQK